MYPIIEYISMKQIYKGDDSHVILFGKDYTDHDLILYFSKSIQRSIYHAKCLNDLLWFIKDPNINQDWDNYFECEINKRTDSQLDMINKNCKLTIKHITTNDINSQSWQDLSVSSTDLKAVMNCEENDKIHKNETNMNQFKTRKPDQKEVDMKITAWNSKTQQKHDVNILWGRKRSKISKISIKHTNDIQKRLKDNNNSKIVIYP